MKIQTQAGELRMISHVVERYVERVKPAFSWKQARAELALLLPQATVSETIPEWGTWHPEDYNADGHTDYFLVLCESIVFPVRESTVKTALPRGTFPPSVRFSRTEGRKSRHSRHRAEKLAERSGVRRRQRKADGKRDDNWRQERAA